MATRVIHVPTSEMLWPMKKSRKLRPRSARQACEIPVDRARAEDFARVFSVTAAKPLQFVDLNAGRRSEAWKQNTESGVNAFRTDRKIPR